MGGSEAKIGGGSSLHDVRKNCRAPRKSGAWRSGRDEFSGLSSDPGQIALNGGERGEDRRGQLITRRAEELPRAAQIRGVEVRARRVLRAVVRSWSDRVEWGGARRRSEGAAHYTTCGRIAARRANPGRGGQGATSSPGCRPILVRSR